MRTTPRLALALALAALASTLVAGCPDHTCGNIKSEATDLRDTFAQCSAGEKCVVVDLSKLVGDNCFADLQCGAAMPEARSQQEFARRAQNIIDDYKGCTDCEKASCVPVDSLVATCNPATGRCETAPKPAQ